MSYTLESVIKKLGEEAQLTGGRIVVFRDGKHTDVGGISPADGVFSLTEAGKILLENTAEKVEEPKGAKAPKVEKGLKPTTAKSDEDLLNVGLE